MGNETLRCSLTLPAVVRSGDAVPLVFTLENTGASALRVLKWNTPLEGFFGNYLQITGPAGDIRYEGPMVKRGAPEDEDYIALKPLEKKTVTVDLALPYRIAQPGRYTVHFTGNLVDVTAEPAPRPLEKFKSMKLRCPTATFELRAAAPRR
jgi:hypothetical protein